MVALTLIAVVVSVLHPIAWTDEEMWLAALTPGLAGGIVFFAALGLGRLDTAVVVGSVAVTPLQVALLLALTSPVVIGLFSLAGRWGFGPLGDAART